MKRLAALSGFILSLLMVIPAFAQERDFCWKDTATRGVGTVPQACEAGRERIGLLCYTSCPAGMKRVGSMPRR